MNDECTVADERAKKLRAFCQFNSESKYTTFHHIEPWEGGENGDKDMFL